MRSSIFISFLSLLLASGCSSSDVEDYVKGQVENIDGLVHDGGNRATELEENITITGQEVDAVEAHNRLRGEVGVNQELTWSSALADAAKVYADKLANSGRWEHDIDNHKNGYGENLYTSTEKVTLEDATIAWGDEKQYYHYSDNSCDSGEQCGHYTQIVWKNTSKVGCATSQYKTGQYKFWYVVVCKYQTPGNYIGEKPY